MLKVLEYTGDITADIARILRRAETDIKELSGSVQDIVDGVKERGDAALVDFTAKFDKVDISNRTLRVSAEELEGADALLSDEIKRAMRQCADNIIKFHKAQMPSQLWMEEIAPGVMAGEKVSAIDTVALYVPRGKGAFPSVMLMLGIPAMVAGCERVVIVTPPCEDGSIDPATIYAARLAGHTELYRVGGAHAIAALAYGTDSLPKVDKVLGPGNQYVTAAKRLLADILDPGVPAGPSESIILCDESADAETVARDLLIEAEHGPDSAALLVTHRADIIEAASKIVSGLVENLPEPRRTFVTSVFSNYGGAIKTASLDASFDFVNRFAPEHLECIVAEPMVAIERVKHAGEILLGPHAPITIGNFSLGVNAILPTGGRARTSSCLTVHDFMKRTSIGIISEQGFNDLAGPAREMAHYEGFPAHAAAIEYRLAKKTGGPS